MLAEGGEGVDEIIINPVAEFVIVGPEDLVIGIENPFIVAIIVFVD